MADGADQPAERRADAIPVEGRADAVPAEGRAGAVPAEGRAGAVPPEGRADAVERPGPGARAIATSRHGTRSAGSSPGTGSAGSRPGSGSAGSPARGLAAALEQALAPVGDLDGAAALVGSAGELLRAVDQGAVDEAVAQDLLPALVGMTGVMESTMNALAARRAVVVALAAAVAERHPGVMVPLAPGQPATATDQELARRALVADLASASGTSEPPTATLVETSTEVVRRLPGLLTLMGAGIVGDRQAQRVARHTDGLPDEAMGLFESLALARVDADRTAAGLDRAARRAREKVHRTCAVERHRRASADRMVRVDPAPDGMAWLTAFLPAVQATAIHDRLTRLAASLEEEQGEQRTLAQRRADVLTALTLDGEVPGGGGGADAVGGEGLVGLLQDGLGTDGVALRQDGLGTDEVALRQDGFGTDGGPRAGRATSGGPPDRDGACEVPGERGARDQAPAPDVVDPPWTVDPAPDVVDPPWTLDPALRHIRPTVAVTVPVLTLLGVSEEPAELEGYGPIDPETARYLAAQAPSFIRLLTHPETGAVLSVGRDRYTVPADLRTWARLRDGTCRFPGCHRAATGCEMDHTVPFREGGAAGETAGENLAHLCRSHHRLKHATRWRVVQGDDAALTWTSPTGRVHVTRPERDMRPDGQRSRGRSHGRGGGSGSNGRDGDGRGGGGGSGGRGG